jgi:hypothetical protein
MPQEVRNKNNGKPEGKNQNGVRVETAFIRRENIIKGP